MPKATTSIVDYFCSDAEKEIKFLLIRTSENAAECIICGKIVRYAFSPYYLSRHYTSLHKERYQNFSPDERRALLTEYRKKKEKL